VCVGSSGAVKAAEPTANATRMAAPIPRRIFLWQNLENHELSRKTSAFAMLAMRPAAKPGPPRPAREQERLLVDVMAREAVREEAERQREELEADRNLVRALT
jgi:hypothetical protein